MNGSRRQQRRRRRSRRSRRRYLVAEEEKEELAGEGTKYSNTSRSGRRLNRRFRLVEEGY